MNGTPETARALTEAILSCKTKARVVVCPPATLLSAITGVAKGGQDCSSEASGAFTGDISATMLKEAGCDYVIVGHSERRQQHGETDALVRAKAVQAAAAGLVPIICIGETLAEREAGRAFEVVESQVRGSFPPPKGGRVAEGREGATSAQDNTPSRSTKDMQDACPSRATSPLKGEVISPQFILAYEPVWAIGTGKTPTAEDIRAMHTHILAVAARETGLAQSQISVLYGGSGKSGNAKEILAIDGVAGVLVGGASLVAEEFCSICTQSY